MAKLMLFVSLLLVMIASVFGDDVLVLTKDNFDSTVNNAELIVVEFYAPWCGHCKNLEPEYAKAAASLKHNDPPVLLAKVDATVETDLASRFGVRGYPTLKIFRKGSESPYNGPRDHQGIVNYLLKQVGPSAKPLSSKAEVDSFIADPDVSIIGFFAQPDSELAKIFKSVADTLREGFRFGIVTDKPTLAQFDYQQAVVLFKSFDEKKNVYSGGYNAKDLNEWVHAKAIPVAGEITKANQDRFYKRGLPVLKVYFDVDYGSNVKRTNYYLNRLKKVVTDTKAAEGKLLFAIANKGTYRDELDRAGVSSGDDFAVVIEDRNANLRYKYSHEEFNLNNLQSFVNDFLGGKLKPFIKSQTPPEKNDGPVSIVTGETFNSIVLDESKDVLFEMYAPWCGHCKKLEPIYEELGKKAQKEWDNLVIAKMDATANDSPHSKYQAKGYPTIFFAPAGKKDNPVAFGGDREVKNFLEFIKNNASAAKKKKTEL